MTEERPSVVIEAVVVGAAVLVGLCAVSLWVGVLIAALVFGSHRAIRVSFRDALNALSHVASHWGDPKLLWPRAVRSAVPDAWAVWGCTVPVLVLLGAVAGVALWLVRRRRVGPERRRRMGRRSRGAFRSRLGRRTVVGTKPRAGPGSARPRRSPFGRNRRSACRSRRVRTALASASGGPPDGGPGRDRGRRTVALRQDHGSRDPGDLGVGGSGDRAVGEGRPVGRDRDVTP